MTEVRAADSRIETIEARSAAFRKELGFLDLVLVQIMYVVGSGWVGTAAKLGTSHIVFWLLAAMLFYLPQAAVVTFLSRLMPLEGGIYQWATAAFGERFGFMAAWNLWVYTILIMATFGVMVATNIAYLVGPLGAAVTSAPWYTFAASAAIILGITAVSLLGLRVGKWVQNVGGTSQLLTFAALIAVPFFAVHRGTIPAYHPLEVSVPVFTILSLNILGKMALGAFSGFEYVAILSGECRNPSREIGRSVLVAVPIIATMFIMGTSSVVALVPSDRIDLVSPIPQTLTIGYRELGLARGIVPVLVLLLVFRQIGNMTLLFAGNTRLPLVAGWDGLLPAWFTRLHPRFRTPWNSILCVGAITLTLSLAGQAGVGVQEAFQLLENAAGIFYAFTYLAMFAIPILAAHRLAARPSWGLRAAAVAGFAITLLYSVLSIFPIIDVPSWKQFSAKIAVVLLTGNLLGLVIYRLRRPA